MSSHRVSVKVNGAHYEREIEARIHLADFLRHELNLTGTHVGCEHGICGACTVLVDGVSVRACLMLAVQADGCSILTIEGAANADGSLSPVQAALAAHHGLQCGYCTPGVVMTLTELIAEHLDRGPSEAEVRRALSGNLCRCTGYQGMVDAALSLFEKASDGNS